MTVHLWSTPGAARASRRVRVPLSMLAVVLVAAACSRSGSPGHVVDVALKDFHIAPSTSTVPAGTVTFDISSRGPTTHEFVVVRTDLPPGNLPLNADGITVNEHSPSLKRVGEQSDVDIGESTALSLHLPAGHYVLFCNMEGHYLAGMHVSLTVA